MSYKKIIAIYLAFLTIVLSIYPAYAISISNVNVETTSTTATITWQTDSSAEGQVEYGKTANLGNSAQSETGQQHSVNIENLDENTEYLYKIKVTSGQDTVYSPETGTDVFTTLQQADIITLENIPAKIPTNRLTLKGKTDQGAVIKIFRTAFNPYRIEETGTFETGADSAGNFVATILLSPGANNIIVTARNSRYGSKQLTVEVDITEPDLRIEDIIGILRVREVNLTGVVEEGATVRYSVYRIINDTYREAVKVNQSIELQNNRFNVTISLGSGQVEGYFLIVITATDEVGNTKTVQKKVYVDNKAPAMVTLPEIPPEVHFFILDIEGKVSEPSTVCVKNLLEETSRTDFAEAGFGIVGRGEVIEQGGITYYRVAVSLDILGALIAGYDNCFDTDADGGFDGKIALAEGPNNLEFFIVDKAGNAIQFLRSVKLDSGNSMWRIGRITTIPNFIYTDVLRAERGGADIGLIYYLHYIGPDFPEMSCGQGCVVTRPARGFTKESLVISLRNEKSYFDRENKQIFVYTTVHIEPYGGDVYKLPDQLKLELAATVTMNYGKLAYGRETVPIDSRPVYFEATVAIEKPLKYSKWLTPKMINKTREILDKIIDPLEKVVNFAEKLSVFTLGVCSLYIAYSYLVGEPNYKTLYTICDRVQCPYVPPDCKEITKSWDVDGREFIDEQRVPLEGWYRDKRLSPTDVAAYIDQKTYNAKENSDKNNYVSVGANVYKYSDNIIITDDRADAVYYVTTSDGRQIVAELEKRGGCPRGYSAVKITRQVKPSPLDTTFNRNAKGTATLVECALLSREDWNKFDIKNVNVLQPYAGCYHPGPDAYDNTKCLDQSIRDTNPFEDISSSVRCGCFTGIRGNLNNLLQVFQAMDKCLAQAYIGQVRGGYCERLMAQFACDLFITVIKKMTDDRTKTVPVIEPGRPVRIDAYQEINDRLDSRYGTGAFSGQFGLSSEQLVHKTCIAAISADWSGFQDLVRATARAPAEPIIGPLMPESRIGAYDPFTGELTINYLYTLGIMSGGQPIEYSVELECNPGAPNGGACPVDRKAMPIIRTGYVAPGGVISQNILEGVKGRGNYWYNVAILRVRYMLGKELKEKVITEPIKHQDVLIPECQIDINQHMVICEVIVPEGLGSVDIGKAYISANPTSFFRGNKIAVKMYLKTLGSPSDNFLIHWVLQKDGKTRADSNDYPSESTEATLGIEKSLKIDATRYMNDYRGRNQYIIDMSEQGGTVQQRFGETALDKKIDAGKIFVIEAVSDVLGNKQLKEIEQIEIITDGGTMTKADCTPAGLILMCQNKFGRTVNIAMIKITINSETGVTVYYVIDPTTEILNLDVLISASGNNNFAADTQLETRKGFESGTYDLVIGIYKDVNKDNRISEEEIKMPSVEGLPKTFKFGIPYSNQPPTYCGKTGEAAKENRPPTVEIVSPDYTVMGIEPIKGLLTENSKIVVNVVDDCNNINEIKLTITGTKGTIEIKKLANEVKKEDYLTYVIELEGKWQNIISVSEDRKEVTIRADVTDKEGKTGSFQVIAIVKFSQRSQ